MLTAEEGQRASAERFGEAYFPAFEEILEGRPRRMIESFLVIDDKQSAMVVEFRLNGNQVFVHREVFEPLKHWRDGLEVVILKDRQATMTSFLQAVAFSFVISFPNIHAVHVFQDVDTGKQLMERLGLFWDRLDPWMLDHDGQKIVKVGDSKTDLVLEFWENGQLMGKSGYLIISAGAREFGAGITPNIIIYDEYDLYPDLELVGRLNAAKGTNCKTFKLSTPRGMKQLHTDYFAAKDGHSGAQAIAIYCFQNVANFLERGHRLSPPPFRQDFALLPEHHRILESPEWAERTVFEDDERIRGFFRWWEWKRQEIRQLLSAQGVHDEERVLGELEAEHCSNDRDCWLNLGKTPFSRSVMLDYIRWGEQARNKREAGSLGVPGVSIFMLEPPRVGMAYACGMDCAWGRGLGDDAAAFIRDAAGNYVCMVRGRGKFDLKAMTRALVLVLWEYGKGEWEPLFAPEVDGGLGDLVIEVAKAMGYRNFWKVPLKSGQNYDRYSLDSAKYGWRTQNNKEEMLQKGVARFNNRDCRILDLDFLRDATNFDPTLEKHTSDSIMAFSITESITDAEHLRGFGRQFAQMAAQVRSGRMGAAPKPARIKVFAGRSVASSWRG